MQAVFEIMPSDNLNQHAESCHYSHASTSPFNAPSLEGRVSPGNNKRAIPSEIISGSGKSDEADHHPTSVAEVSSSPLKRFDHKDALSKPTSQVTLEGMPLSRTKGDIIGYSDIYRK